MTAVRQARTARRRRKRILIHGAGNAHIFLSLEILRHHAEGIFMAERLFGTIITNYCSVWLVERTTESSGRRRAAIEAVERIKAKDGAP